MELLQDKREQYKMDYQRRLTNDPTFRQKMNDRSLNIYYKLKAARTEIPKRGRPKKPVIPVIPIDTVIRKSTGRPRKYLDIV